MCQSLSQVSFHKFYEGYLISLSWESQERGTFVVLLLQKRPLGLADENSLRRKQTAAQSMEEYPDSLRA